MNFGFNSNVRVGDALYHVQTEDRGPSHPFLDTAVYLSGRVVYKRSTNYEKFAGGIVTEKLADSLHGRLSQQHREVISELEAGKLPFQNQENTQTPAKDATSQDALELRLTNPKSLFAAGNVVLEIELRAKDSRTPVADADIEAFLEFEKRRVPCAGVRTDVEGHALLKFPIPQNASDGASLVVRATDGSRYGELRFRLKSKPRDTTPAPAAR